MISPVSSTRPILSTADRNHLQPFACIIAYCLRPICNFPSWSQASYQVCLRVWEWADLMSKQLSNVVTYITQRTIAVYACILESASLTLPDTKSKPRSHITEYSACQDLDAHAMSLLRSIGALGAATRRLAFQVPQSALSTSIQAGTPAPNLVSHLVR